jgi:hypothetical protein
MKQAIHQVAAQVLADGKRSMTVDEIYEVIVSKGLYEFKAKSPKSVLRSQLRRHCGNTGEQSKMDAKSVFQMLSDGRFALLDS